MRVGIYPVVDQCSKSLRDIKQVNSVTVQDIDQIITNMDLHSKRLALLLFQWMDLMIV